MESSSESKNATGHGAVVRQGQLAHVLRRTVTFGSDAIKTRRLNALLMGRTLRPGKTQACLKSPLRGHYLVSSEQGIFHVYDRFVRNIFPFYTFGLSVDRGCLFAAVSFGEWSCIVSARIDLRDDDIVELSSFRLLRVVETKYHNERIHQLHVRGGRIAVANTRTNSILLLDAETGKLILDIYPISDSTGFPIKNDHNHINSVYQAGEVLFFAAHSAGRIGSFLGYIHGGRVTASGFPNRGIHDIIPTSDGLVFSDTFGASLADFRGGGNLVVGGRAVLPSIGEKGFMIRGVAGSQTELVVGHSNHGNRADRFKANGALLVLERLELKCVNEVPFSQVHDIIRVDGRKMDSECDIVKADAAKRLLVRDVGDLAYESGYHVLQPGCADFTPGAGF